MIMRLKKEIQELKNELAMVTGEQRLEELSKEELLEYCLVFFMSSYSEIYFFQWHNKHGRPSRI